MTEPIEMPFGLFTVSWVGFKSHKRKDSVERVYWDGRYTQSDSQGDSTLRRGPIAIIIWPLVIHKCRIRTFRSV